MLTDVLLVDPNAGVLVTTIRRALATVAEVELCAGFRGARARLLTKQPDLLVTNLRLGEYNGLHLVVLVAPKGTRCVVYAAQDDLVLAREVQRLGAFYERLSRLPFALPSYLTKTLPERDRRDVIVLDRRRLSFRGGRRSTDRYKLAVNSGVPSVH